MNRFDDSVSPTPLVGEAEGTGYLIVRVSTARGAIPLENAIVRVRAAAAPDESLRGEGAPGDGILIASLLTDRDGLAPRLALPAPARALSERPGNGKPYALYDIDVMLDGYMANYYQNVPVFDTVTSLQTVELIPAAEGERPELGQTPPVNFFRSSENEML